MAVIVGSARIDERGKAYGGSAGDQTGKEVSAQNYYVHSKGWRVLRAKDPAKAKLIADAMRAACKNNNIGYDQWQRDTLYNHVKPKGFDPAKATSKVETDCSALVRVCCGYAGIAVGNFRTYNQAKMMLATGAFTELTGSKYTTQSVYLKEGDVLVTKTSGHTIVVLSDGDKADATPDPDKRYELGERTLRNGSKGKDVKEMQGYLIELGYDLGRYADDGDFGDSTEIAVRKFQTAEKLEVDGVYGPKTHDALMAAMDKAEDEAASVDVRKVVIRGGSCYVRSAPNTSGAILGAVTAGTVLPYGGQTSEDGWLLVAYKQQNGWVSGKYGKLSL